MASLVCSFCGKSQDKVQRILIGPGVNICSDCIDTCTTIQSGALVPNWAVTTSAAVQCSFCGQRPAKRRYILVSPSCTICEDCVKLTRDIVSGVRASFVLQTGTTMIQEAIRDHMDHIKKRIDEQQSGDEDGSSKS